MVLILLILVGTFYHTHFSEIIEMHDPGHMQRTLMRIYKNFEDKKKTRGAGKYLKWYFAATCNDKKMSISEKEEHL